MSNDSHQFNPSYRTIVHDCPLNKQNKNKQYHLEYIQPHDVMLTTMIATMIATSWLGVGHWSHPPLRDTALLWSATAPRPRRADGTVRIAAIVQGCLMAC